MSDFKRFQENDTSNSIRDILNTLKKSSMIYQRSPGQYELDYFVRQVMLEMKNDNDVVQGASPVNVDRGRKNDGNNFDNDDEFDVKDVNPIISSVNDGGGNDYDKVLRVETPDQAVKRENLNSSLYLPQHIIKQEGCLKNICLWIVVCVFFP